jgi:glutamate racemase
VSKNCRIGVIGTRSTIESQAYQTALLKRNNAVKVTARSCPLFVPLVEEGMTEGMIVEKITEYYLQGFKKDKIDTLILGCTHYPLLKKVIASRIKGATIVDSAKEVAGQTRIVLNRYGLLNAAGKKGEAVFYVSDEAEGFARSARFFLKRKISKPKKVCV